MDDNVTKLLEQVLAEQKKQTAILDRSFWRIRFSLLALMLLMTVTGVALGAGIYMFGSPRKPIPLPTTAVPATPYYPTQPPPPTLPYTAPSYRPAPSPDYQEPPKTKGKLLNEQQRVS
jgi:hypothetical protein